MTTKTSSKKSPEQLINSPVPLAKGEKYIDTLPDGKGGQYHLVLMAGDEAMPWQAALDWAKKQGGDLPDRVEQALLYRDHKGEFKDAYYWSGAQYAGDDAYAWGQYFSGGGQGNDRKGVDCRCRAGRRVPIQ